MSRTRLESVGLIWHFTQMLIVTYMFLAPWRIGPGAADPAVWADPTVRMLLGLPFATGWLLAGLLRTPTPNVLLFAALYWALMALAIQTSWFQWEFHMGIAVHFTLWHAPKVSIDVLALASAALFATAWHKRRLTIVGGGRDALVVRRLGR